MQADIKGAYEQLNTSWRSFRHRDKSLTRLEVKMILEYAIRKDYKTTLELSDEEVDELLKIHRSEEIVDYGIQIPIIYQGICERSERGGSNLGKIFIENHEGYFQEMPNGITLSPSDMKNDLKNGYVRVISIVK